MIESAQFYENFLSETEVLLAEVEQWLQAVVIECPEYYTLELSANGLELNNVDTVMASYLLMIEVTPALEGVLDKIRHNDIAFNGQLTLWLKLLQFLIQ